MVVDKPADLRPLVPQGRRLMGLDLGSRTIGCALSDVGWMIASPVTTIRRTKFSQDAKILLELFDGKEASAFVIGLPMNMDGSEGPRCQSVRAFAGNLLKIRDVPIAFWDERLSTAAVQRMLISEADASRKRRAEVVDKLAAAYILQGALDAMRR